MEGLREDGCIVTYLPQQTLSYTLSMIHHYEGIIINSKTLCDDLFFSRANNLEFIGRLGSGLEIIDLDLAKEKGVKVLNTPEANCGAVAEHALGMVLGLFNNLRKSSDQLSQFIWHREENRGTELSSKTIGIIGYGHTGSAFATLLQPFGCKLLCHDKYKRAIPFESSLESIWDEADVISLHLPFTKETKHYIDDYFLEKCKKQLYIINTGRGQNICTKSLLQGLDNGRILGACLDVFENEKPHTYNGQERDMYKDLMNRPNVLCTPHIAGWTHESLERIATTMLQKIRSI